MAMGPKLHVRQQHQLAMTPQLRQSIQLLQLSALDLAGFIQQEVEQNPFLVQQEQSPEKSPNSTNENPDAPWPEEQENLAYESLHYDRSGGGHASGDDAANWIEETVTREKNLREHLIGQLNVDIASAEERLIGLALIDALDESGYIGEPLESIAETLGCDVLQVRAVLEMLQRFDPPGIFARNLAECLALQLREKNRLDPAMSILLENLELLGRREFSRLEKLCGLGREDILEMYQEIRLLDPKPASSFASEAAAPVIPHVYVRRRGEEFSVELNGEALPRLLVNHRYYTRVAGHSMGPEEKKYLNERFGSAKWLVKALDQRARTILRVSSEIVLRQREFFIHGIGYLKPMALKDIAEALELHESTISRVTSNKFMDTPRGMVEMKFFFSSSVANVAGEDVSSEAVRHLIRDIVDAEDPKHPLSDEAITKALQAKGLEIARRTVAKYREAMGIGSSPQRRREKGGR